MRVEGAWPRFAVDSALLLGRMDLDFFTWETIMNGSTRIKVKRVKEFWTTDLLLATGLMEASVRDNVV